MGCAPTLGCWDLGRGLLPPIGTGLCWYLTREVVVGSTIVRRQVPAFQAPSEVAWSYNLH